ncbi:MAG TPA: hypothetical protein VHR72_00815, partial [Gemmataceae bacterium]|nr:hypothetical protein [Gemmataceae bacterium]
MDRSLALRLFVTPQPHARRRMRPVFDVLEDRVVPTAYTWNGSTDGNWVTAANWTPSGVPGSADSATFPATLTAAQTVTLPDSVTTSVSAIVFAETAAGVLVTIAPGSGSTLAPTTISSSAAVSPVISTPLTLKSTNSVVVTGSAPLTLSGAIATAGPNKSGTGTLVLVGTNTFSGNYTLSAGVLSVSADGNFGNTTTGSTLVLNGATAVLDVTAAMLVNGQHHISAGVSGGTIEGIGGGNLTLAGSVLSSSGPNPMTIASDTAGATVLTMSSAQSLTGPVTLASGRILDSSTSSTPFGSATVTVLAGAQIEFSGNVSYQSKLNIAGSGSDGRGALVFDGVTNSFTHLGNLTLTADSTLGYVGTAGGTISISSGLLGAFNLTLGGFLGSTAATWTVAAPATATPNIVVSATSSVQTLAMLTSSYAGVLSGGGNVVIGSTLSGMNTYGGTTTLSSDSTTTLTGGDNRLPAGTTLRFGFNGVATDGLNVGSTNQTFASILFANSSSFTPAESAVINGAGSVTVTGRGDLVLGPADSNVRGAALYMAGLGTFDFASPSNAFRVELPATYASNGVLGNPLDTVELAAVSTIAASLLDVGNQGGFSQIFTTPIVLALGKTNIIDTPEIDVGYGSETSATLDFKSSTGPPTVMIRNADGVSPVDTWLVGDIDAPATPNFLPEQSIVDLSAGTTDAKVHALTLGSGVLTS